MKIRLPIILLSLAGCAPSAAVTEESKTKNPVSEIGRFEFHAASKDLPAYILDTTSGCVSHIAQMETAMKESDWVELSTRFSKWSCPQDLTEKLKLEAEQANLK
jgi:hypothetical protein